MAQGIRVKDLEAYTGDLNRNDLSIPLDGDDFVTAQKITGKQLKDIIMANFEEIEAQFQGLEQGIESAQDVIDILLKGTWNKGWS